MKLFDTIQHFVKKPQKVEAEIYVSLLLEEAFIQAGAWVVGEGKKPQTLSTASERAPSPTWEERIRMADHAIGKLEEETGSTKLSKVVLGLGESFLTPNQDIEKSARGHLKELTKSLGLTPLGFVPLPTSIVHYLRCIEGIPISVILIGVDEQKLHISIYRVGRLAFSRIIDRTEAEDEDVEEALKECTDADVLPSRILLYGSEDVRIQDMKALLLKHQWTSRANFLHYPKVDIFPFERLIETVVTAGANELTQTIIEDAGAEPVEEKEGPKQDTQEKKGVPEEKKGSLTEEPEEVEKKGPSHMVVVQPETVGFHETNGDHIHASHHEDSVSNAQTQEEDNPLEFAREQKENLLEQEDQGERRESLAPSETSGIFHRVSGSIRRMGRMARSAGSHMPMKLFIILLLIAAVGAIGMFALTTYLPRATVTLTVLTQDIAHNDTIAIDPETKTIDSEKKIIPAQKLEKVVSGEKTVPATGRKKIGDPSKGIVTIYNKSETSGYSLKKGTVLTNGQLQFTLDTDVAVATASMNISGDQLTFGKASAGVTAVAVGPEGNVESGKEFTVKEYAASVLIGRNEKPFTGGTSKEVTVVARADIDTLQKALTADLIEKAKAELAQSVSGKDRMVDDTIKTTVQEKQFVEEIDQESKELHGSLTISVSAYTYNEDDVKSLLSDVVTDQVPPGYSINPGRTTVTVGEVNVMKNGQMTAKATLSAQALPDINEDSVKKSVAGKNLTEVTQELKSLPGVASAAFSFTSSISKTRLPRDPSHISISVSAE